MDEQQEKAIATMCQEMGLAIGGVRRRGAVLVLEPAEGGSLPDAERLGAIARALSEQGYRYVTLDLAGFETREVRDA
ncbi:hypothetical protein DL240_09725 [Lujinxingia litoralis]|uniref:Uncharacterized protein n=1 Tax=Lujinxingia litoralis TaxID=2211119 RepID=A0A328C6N2_9DELT|nr:hypothetical protein [Lujinxingia litoralis]RAL22124.1 hypothetical protein DL240_09725 [Lujinxingia litoralis]